MGETLMEYEWSRTNALALFSLPKSQTTRIRSPLSHNGKCARNVLEPKYSRMNIHTRKVRSFEMTSRLLSPTSDLPYAKS